MLFLVKVSSDRWHDSILLFLVTARRPTYPN